MLCIIKIQVKVDNIDLPDLMKDFKHSLEENAIRDTKPLIEYTITEDLTPTD